jgi:hypothetical protein
VTGCPGAMVRPGKGTLTAWGRMKPEDWIEKANAILMAEDLKHPISEIS